jgi:hypothetical protein
MGAIDMKCGYFKQAGTTALTMVIVACVVFLAPRSVLARDSLGTTPQVQRYIVDLQDPPLALYDGRRLSVAREDGSQRLLATVPKATGEARLNAKSPAALDYLEYLSSRHRAFRLEAASLLGRELSAVHKYRFASNGMAVDLTPAEAEILAESPLVRSINRDSRHKVETFAGPQWLGAEALWNGDAGFSSTRGENIVMGIIDSGINWEHPSFDNPSPDGYIHENPFGTTLGLCGEEDVVCNGKIIGVYDFVEDNPSTEDVVEENTNGRDNTGHGSHVASIAAGNPANIFLEGAASVTLSGVAPRANIISYRVCYAGEPAGADSGGCMGSAILSAIEQAIQDGVDVINYSIGSISPCTPGSCNPWSFGTEDRAFLGARAAGIFVATSAGNEGPNPETLSSPANAPWLMTVGYATHDQTFGSVLEDLSGGSTAPPELVLGATLTNGIGVRKIVHAKDFGFPLCGTGEAELQSSCDGNLGLSNPWDGDKPFNGEIVVCDRGDYGRVEKGKNVLLAGAGGLILANSSEFGESVTADLHCLPALHIGQEDGDALRNWLDSGGGHQGAINDKTLLVDDRFADEVAFFSSRGPGVDPVDGVLKPNLIAPGVEIWAASDQGQQFWRASGSSMSSPHVTGSAALLKSVHPDWGPSQLASVLETTATAELATDRVDGSEATPHQRGAGRPQLADAVNAGLFLDVQESEFLAANPLSGGNPSELNLSGLANAGCASSCGFTRKVTSLGPGGTWTASAMDFPDGVSVQVSPANFTLGPAETRELDFNIDLGQAGVIGDWIFGKIRLSASGHPDQFLTVAVFSDGGDLPSGWNVSDNRNGGWREFELSGLVGLPDATFDSGGLVKPTRTAQVLLEDPSNRNPYDGGEGVFTHWHAAPQGALWLSARTLDSTATDLDLFVGRDDDGDGFADESEELCNSTSPGDIENCDLFDQPPGDYWILVQNWTGTNEEGDEAVLLSAVVSPSGDANFAASGPGITQAQNAFPVRISWDNWNALPGEEWLAAVGVGSERESPNNIGIIPVRLSRSGIAEAKTFPLMERSTHRLALEAGGAHDQLFIDVPAGASSLTVFSNSVDEDQNNGLTLELKRLDFSNAFSDPPFAASPASSPVLVAASGIGGVGPSITVVGVDPGRWYAVLSNGNDSPSAVEVRAELEFQGGPIADRPGLWEPNSRPGLGQGYEFNGGGSSKALVWYTYDELGLPTWYIAANATTAGNTWTADLLRFTNDGAQQQSSPVGQVSITRLAEDDAMFSYTLFGQSGTERMQPISALTCPQISGAERSYTGLWYRGVDGLGGASVLVNAQTQSQIHYLFDGTGTARWLYAQDLVSPAPTNSELPMLQFSGYCALCEATSVSSETVGMLERSFSSEIAGSWTLDYVFAEPLTGSVNRTDQIQKLTDTLVCE